MDSSYTWTLINYLRNGLISIKSASIHDKNYIYSIYKYCFDKFIIFMFPLPYLI